MNYMIQIREETQTKIDLPAEGEKSDVITITGKKENVEKAKEMIQKIQNELVNVSLNIFYIYCVYKICVQITRRNNYNTYKIFITLG